MSEIGSPGRELSRVATSLLVATLLLTHATLTGYGESATEPLLPEPLEVGVVVNSVDLSLSLFPVDSLSSTRTVGLGADGSPVGLSVRGGLAVVPMGIVPVLKVVDLREGTVIRSIALPQGSGATGSAWATDSIVVVANPMRNTVSPVNVHTGVVAGEIPVGGYPESVVSGGGRVYVLNSELGPDYLPSGPGTVTVLEAGTLATMASIQLSGENPGSGVVGPDGRLYVVNRGRFFGNSGSVSVVDAQTLQEVQHITGFGDFPSAVAVGPDGYLYLAAFSFGVIVWNPLTGDFIRGVDEAVTPGEVPSVSGLAFDSEGRLYTLLPECQAPGAAYRLDETYSVQDTVQVGTCPFGIAFGDLEVG